MEFRRTRSRKSSRRSYGITDQRASSVGPLQSEGFSHFVTSMTAPVASGWSGCRVGLAPTGKRRLCTAHAKPRLRRRKLSIVTPQPGRRLLGLKPSIHLDEEPAIVVRSLSSTPHPALQDDQLVSEHRILRLKPALRLERRGQHGQKKPDQRDHRANLIDSSLDKPG